jgi:hypothetical protein
MLGAAALTLSACATTPYTPTPYDRSSAGVTDIVVIGDAFPDQPDIQKLATNGANMAGAMAAQAGLAGLLVGAVAAGIESGIAADQTKRMRTALASQGFDAEAIFDRALETALMESGYGYRVQEVPRNEKRELLKFIPNPNAEPGSAVLDVSAAGYGYQLIGGGTTWRPFVAASVRVTDPKDPTRVLLDNRIAYNPVATPEVIVNLPADEIYSFEKMDALEADPVKAAEGLNVALVAAWVGACATVETAPPSPPVLELSGKSCDDSRRLGAPTRLTPDKPRQWNYIATSVTASTPCLSLEGRQGYYVVYELPPNGPNHVVTVGGAQEPIRIFAPEVFLLDADGKVVRSFAPEKYMVLGDTFGVQFKPAGAERFLVVQSNPLIVGMTRAGVEQRLIAGTGTACGVASCSSYTTYSGAEGLASRTFSHEGIVSVRVQAVSGMIGEAAAAPKS